MDDGESTVAETIDRVAVASAIYDHVKAQLEVDARVYTTFQQKVRHLMTVHLALLAGLSYGLKHCGWAIQTSNSLHGLALAIIGGSSFFLVFAAFSVPCNARRFGTVR